MKYLSIVAIWISVYISSIYFFKLDDEYFFVVQSFWSLSIILFIIPVERSFLTLSVSSVELLHIFINYIACIEYISGDYTDKFIYVNYEVIINSINGLAFLLLLYRGPGNGGVFKRIPRLFTSNTDNTSINYWSVAYNKALNLLQKKEEEKCSL